MLWKRTKLEKFEKEKRPQPREFRMRSDGSGCACLCSRIPWEPGNKPKTLGQVKYKRTFKCKACAANSIAIAAVIGVVACAIWAVNLQQPDEMSCVDWLVSCVAIGTPFNVVIEAILYARQPKEKRDQDDSTEGE